MAAMPYPQAMEAVLKSGQLDKEGSVNVRLGSFNKKGQLKSGEKWTFLYINLISGSLHYYGKKQDVDPKGTLQVADTKLHQSVEIRPFKHCFSCAIDLSSVLPLGSEAPFFHHKIDPPGHQKAIRPIQGYS